MITSVLCCLALAVSYYPSQAASTTFTVNTGADNTTTDGACTLREAILAANGTPANTDCGADTGAPYAIAFNIGGGGVQTIAPASAFATLARAVAINGTTQPGCSADPCIELNGAGAGAANGLTISAGNSTIEGLVINRFNGMGIELTANGANNLLGNYVGVNISGTQALANSHDGIYICCGSNSNVIGGTTAAARNVVSGNSAYGVQIDQASSGNWVQGNYVGLGADGLTPLSNHYDGIMVGRFGGTPANNNTIGRKLNGSGTGNTIANNNGNGITIGINKFDPSSDNTILGNAIFANGCLGIDLSDNLVTGCSGGVSVTANHLNCNATGPNQYQNYPVLDGAGYGGGFTTILGTLNCKPSASYVLEFFASGASDASGFGEGRTWLGTISVTTDVSGNAPFTANFVTINTLGQFVSATATDPSGNTSEFAHDVTAVFIHRLFLPLMMR